MLDDDSFGSKTASTSEKGQVANDAQVKQKNDGEPEMDTDTAQLTCKQNSSSQPAGALDEELQTMLKANNNVINVSKAIAADVDGGHTSAQFIGCVEAEKEKSRARAKEWKICFYERQLKAMNEDEVVDLKKAIQMRMKDDHIMRCFGIEDAGFIRYVEAANQKCRQIAELMDEAMHSFHTNNQLNLGHVLDLMDTVAQVMIENCCKTQRRTEGSTSVQNQISTGLSPTKNRHDGTRGQNPFLMLGCTAILTFFWLLASAFLCREFISRSDAEQALRLEVLDLKSAHVMLRSDSQLNSAAINKLEETLGWSHKAEDMFRAEIIKFEHTLSAEVNDLKERFVATQLSATEERLKSKEEFNTQCDAEPSSFRDMSDLKAKISEVERQCHSYSDAFVDVEEARKNTEEVLRAELERIERALLSEGNDLRERLEMIESSARHVWLNIRKTEQANRRVKKLTAAVADRLTDLSERLATEKNKRREADQSFRQETNDMKAALMKKVDRSQLGTVLVDLVEATMSEMLGAAFAVVDDLLD